MTPWLQGAVAWWLVAFFLPCTHRRFWPLPPWAHPLLAEGIPVSAVYAFTGRLVAACAYRVATGSAP